MISILSIGNGFKGGPMMIEQIGSIASAWVIGTQTLALIISLVVNSVDLGWKWRRSKAKHMMGIFKN